MQNPQSFFMSTNKTTDAEVQKSEFVKTTGH
jgi:hypothetical protein